MNLVTRLALGLAALASSVSAATYYVSPTGSDSNTGAIGAPFLTIQHAAGLMVAGDTCYLRKGVYRETVTPANSGTSSSPLTFAAYAGESVVVSGANVLSGTWSVYSGSIYSTSTALAIPQLFDNGVMMNVARWPNARPDYLLSAPRATVQSSTGETNLTDSNLPSVSLVGATLHLTPGNVGGEWAAFTRPITAYNTTTKTISWASSVSYTINPGNHYYVYGLLSLLDTPTEYFLDSSAHLLYLWTPNGASPATHTIEYKARTLAFDLSNKSYVDLSGINIFAAGVNLTNTTSCTVDHCNVRYVQQNMTADWLTTPIPCANFVSGTGSSWTNSTIMFSSQDGLQLAGTGAVVNNCYISDVDSYPGSYYAAITTKSGTGHVISHNTLTRSGRYLIWPTAPTISISYNDLSYGEQLTRDGGAIYIYNFDGAGTTIDHNWSHNTEIGIYLDNNAKNFKVFHNVCFDNDSVGIRINAPGEGHQIYNNTIVANPQSFAMYNNAGGTADQAGTNVVNNLTDNVNYTLAPNATLSNNGAFPIGSNFLPTAGSGAIDAGIVAAPYTNGYLGSAPDIGAYEYGDPAPWVPGASISPPLFPTFDLATVPSAPTGLSASTTATEEVDLTWVAPPSAVSGYQIQRATSSGGTYTTIATGIVPSAFADRAASPGTTYYYRVAAINSVGTSSYSSVAAGTPYPDPVAEADAYVRSGTFGAINYPSDSAVQVKADPTPTDDYNREAYLKFNVAGLGGAASVKLQLTPLGGSGSVTTAAEFVSDDSWTETGITWNTKPAGSGVILATIPSSTVNVPVQFDITSQVHTEAAGDGMLSIHLYSETTAGSPSTSFGSRENPTPAYRPQLIITAAVGIPAAPTGLSASPGNAQVALSWSTVSGATGYNVKRSLTSGSGYANVATGVAGAAYTDTTVSNGTTYYYVVSATNSSGESANSSQVSATPSAPAIPAAPSGLGATPASSSQINLAWTDNASNETGFYVERSPDGTTFTQIGSVAANVVTYSDTGLTAATTYYYRVRAYNATGDSAYTSVVSATTSSGGGSPTTVDLISIGAQDGYITESPSGSGVGGAVTATNTSSSALRIGDNYSNEGIRTFLAFDTSGIPAGATILSATIKLKRGTISGTDPFTTHGTCCVDIKGGTGFGGSTTLVAADYQAAADAIDVANLTDGASTTGALNSTGIGYINRSGTTQFRLYFTIASDNDGGDDYEGYYSGENSSSGNRPVLEIVYQ